MMTDDAMPRDEELLELACEPAPESDDFLCAVAKAPPVRVPWRASIGDVIDDRYEIEAQIGEGGLGVVYRAQDLRLKRGVALKLLGVLDDPQAFLREARATARVKSSHVVEIYDCGNEPRTAFLVLELLEGKTLAQHVAGRGALPLAEVLPLLCDIASALTRAHKKGVSHRDLSWSNVLVTADEDGVEVKVVDFGFAEILEDQKRKRSLLRQLRSEDLEHALTDPRLLGGTPGFASPEQLSGVDVPFKGDLFGLGVIAFLMLTGEFPFPCPTMEAYRHALMSSAAPRVRSLVPSVPKELDEQVAQLLDKSPSERPATELVRDRLRDLRDRYAPARKKKRKPSIFGEPFRPLCVFEKEDKEIFYGRTVETDDLCKLVMEQRLAVLHGVSGAGKSSLVRAGLLPSLGDNVHVVTAEIGTYPSRAPVLMLQELLATELLGLGETPDGNVETLLLALGRRAGKTVLLVLDQFEEIFLARTPETFRREALELGRALRGAIGHGQIAVHVLVVIRTDFHGHLECLKPELPGIMDHGMLLLPLGPDATREVVEMRFEAAGFECPRGLVEEILGDLTQEGAISPVELELVCHALYERAAMKEARVLLRDDYQRLGRAGKVLEAHLAKVENDWSVERMRIARAIMRQLVTKDGIRVAALGLEELARVIKEPAEAIGETLVVLQKARILVSSRSGVEHHRYRIAHDKMALAVWERLGAREQREIEMREVLRALRKGAPHGTLKFASWLWSGRHEVRKPILDWFANGTEALDDADKAFLARMGEWDQRLRKAPWIAVSFVVLVVSVTIIGIWRVQQNKLQTKLAEKSILMAEHEISREPGMAMAWWAEAKRLGAEDEKSFQTRWLFAQEAERAGNAWIAAKHMEGAKKVFFSPPELAWMQTTGENACTNCWPRRKLLFSFGDGARVLDLERGGLSTELGEGFSKPAGGSPATRKQERFLSAAISPNGSWVAAGCGNAEVHVWVWDEASGAWRSRKLEHPRGAVVTLELTVSSTGKQLAGVWFGGIVDVWDTSTWKHQQRVNLQEHGSSLVAFSADGARVIALPLIENSAESHLQDEPTERLDFIPIPYAPYHAKLSPERDRLVVVGMEEATFFSLHRGVAKLSVDLKENPIKVGPPVREDSFRIWSSEHDGLNFLVGNVLGDVEMHHLSTLILSHSIPIPERIQSNPGAVVSVLPSWDQRWLATARRGGDIEVTHMDSHRNKTLGTYNHEVSTMAISPDDRFITTGGSDGLVRLWGLDAGMERHFELQQFELAELHAPHPDRAIAARSSAGHPTVFNMTKGYVARPIELQTEKFVGMCELPEGEWVVADAENGIAVWNRAGKREREVAELAGITKLVCLPDGRIVFARRQELFLVPANGDTATLLGQHCAYVDALLPTPEGLVVSGSFDGNITVWDPVTSVRLASETICEGTIVGFALVGEHEIVAAQSGNISLWDWSNNSKRKIEFHAGLGGAPTSIAALPTARLLAIGTGDGFIRLQWLDSGVWRDLRGDKSAVRRLEFSLDGRFLTSGNQAGSIHVWRLPPTDRALFESWFDAHTPWTVQNNVLMPNPVPALSTGFGGPEPPYPSDACIEACRKAQPNDAEPDGETMETCILNKRVPACQGERP